MKYLIGALVILALLFLVWWIISRGKQRQLDEQRAEAARIRAGAQERIAALQGQEVFAQQSTERADLARQEAEERARQAEESAREAQRVGAAARRPQAELARGRLERDAELRRADERDPDVEVDKNDPRPLPEDLDDDVRPLDETRVHTPVSAEAPAAAAAGTAGATAVDAPSARDEDAPATSAVTSTGAPADSETVDPEPTGDSAPAAESEPVAEPEAVADSVTTPAAQEQGRADHGWGTGAAAAGAGAAAAGSAYAATRGNERDDASARLASGVDYSDSGVDHQDTVGDRDGGSHHHDDEPVTREWAPVDSSRDADQASDSVSHGDQGDERAQETTMSDEELFGAKAVSNDGAEAGRTNDERDLSDGESRDGTVADGESRDDAVTDGATGASATDGDAAEMTIIGDVEDYASTEPLPADAQTPGTSPEGVEDARREADLAGDSSEEEPTHEETWEDDTDTRGDGGSARDSDGADNGSHDSEAGTTSDWGGAGASGAATGDAMTGRHAGTDGDESSDRDGSTDLGADSSRDADRGDADRGDADLAGDADVSRDEDVTTAAGAESTSDDATGEDGDASHWPDGTDRINTGDDDTDDNTGTGQGDADGLGSGSGSSSRRISAMDEIRDGGFGVGSAAPFEDRAQPLDHPVQAYRDTMTYRTPDADGYDSAEPDVWFYDEDAARRAGFNPSQG